MKSRIQLAALLVAALAARRDSQASEPISVEVFQPIAVEGDWLSLSRMTYVGYHGDESERWLSAVSMTCDSNLVITHEGIQNLNAAYMAGIKVRLDQDAVSFGLFGDTVRVVLDARKMRRTDEFAWTDSTLIAATEECIVANAAQLEAARFVHIQVDGKPGLGRTVSTRRYRCGPPTRAIAAP